MKKIILLLVLSAWTLMGQTPPQDMKLFLLVGQSNMAGRGRVEAEDQKIHPRIFMMDKEMKWVPAKDPIHFDKPGMTGTGLSFSFAKEYAKKEASATIGLIPCAMGGSKLDEWKPGNPLYNNAVNRAKEAMKSGTLVGILWHQGEADSAHENVASYPRRFSQMIQKLRSDLQAENIPVVIGETGHFRAENAEFNANIDKVVAAVPLCKAVSAQDLTDKGDKLHFDSKALRELGKRYFIAFEGLLNGGEAAEKTTDQPSTSESSTTQTN